MKTPLREFLISSRKKFLLPQEATLKRNVYPSARSHVLHAYAFYSRVDACTQRGTRIPSVRSFVLTLRPETIGGSPSPPFANIRAVTTSRNHTALAPRAALSGAAEVGRSTVTAGCTAEAYANRLDFARMAFLFVVKNGACELRFPRRPTSARATMRAIFLAIPARAS